MKTTNSKYRPVLFIEDKPMDIDLTLEAFKDNKIANPVIICRDGEEALAYISAHPHQDDLQLPSLVILDLHLPKVNGIEFLRRARQDPVWKKSPLLFCPFQKSPLILARSTSWGPTLISLNQLTCSRLMRWSSKLIFIGCSSMNPLLKSHLGKIYDEVD